LDNSTVGYASRTFWGLDPAENVENGTQCVLYSKSPGTWRGKQEKYVLCNISYTRTQYVAHRHWIYVL